MKIIITFLFIVFSLLLDLREHKNIMFTISVNATHIYIHNSYRKFTFVESLFLTFLIYFVKDLFIELILFDKLIFADLIFWDFAKQVFLQSLIFGNPIAIHYVCKLMEKIPILDFTINLVDRISQSMLLSLSYQTLLRQPDSTLKDLIYLTLFMSLSPSITLFLGLLEYLSLKEILTKFKNSVIDEMIIYISIFIGIIICEFCNSYSSDDRMIHIIVVNTLFIVSTLLDRIRTKK